MKRFIFIGYVFFWAGLSSFAQEAIVKGRVLETNSYEPIPDVGISIQGSSFNTTTDALGEFNFLQENLPQGQQILIVSKSGYITLKLPIIIQNDAPINLDPVLMEIDLREVEQQIGVISLSDNELDDDAGTSYTISGLLQASDDIFLNAAAYDFSATFFKPRGFDNANGKVLINGIEINKQYDGRPQWAAWGGLNDVQRNQEFSMGLKANDYAFGDVAGTTNIIMRASQYRKGGRVSYASSNRSYRGRVMGSYNSGLGKNGWAYSVLLSRRFGNGGFQEGTIYDANSFFASVEKNFGKNSSLNFTAFYTPNHRGKSAPITAEVEDLKGIDYNPNWGYQSGDVRNSKTKTVEEPVIMLNHFWNLSDKTSLNTNLGYQFGKIGNTRIDYGGTRLIEVDGQQAYIGGARNPYPNYYQRLPSYFLRFENPSAYDYELAYLAGREFINDGQLDWDSLYEANRIAKDSGGNSIYAIQEDRQDDTQLTLNTILNSRVNENITLNGSLSYRNLKSENFAELNDLLGGTGYLDIDYFAEGVNNTIIGDVAQSDLQNRNRIVTEGERYKYNYELNASVISGFVQGQFKYSRTDLYFAATASQTSYQRNGLFENGNFPGNLSLGKSENLSFTNFGGKAGLLYKISGRHLVDFNAGYFTKAPTLRNAFSNSRQSNATVIGLESEKIQNVDLSYIFRSPIVKARLTGYFNTIKNQTDINFFFTESAQGYKDGYAFVQEVITGIDTRKMGAELGIEAQITPTFKLKAAAAFGENVYTNNPNQYLTSDDFDILTFGDKTTKLKNYHVAGGPERAYQVGLEYRDPNFWWVGVTANYFSNAYIDVSTLRRSDAFTFDGDGQTYSDYDPEVAKTLLKQEDFGEYMLVNIVGGKSWRIKGYYVGFFATVNNILDQHYKTGGFEDSRLADYKKVQEDQNRNTPIFGNRYFFGYGTTYYANVYVRF
ncbi:TonB-dependent receptor [Aequorivita todarodis]|uniref:TonB-dependent receptor n=1 Tax=Aequorivita todarodis TaxID=2036821 RepID=UPI00234FFE3A|nr:TonB-dependent receptor [Aequorivita todarodis]MDC8000976.1 TonB-dependent receptor [Aequorivita todarodis]